MAVRALKRRPLVITPEDTIEQRVAGRYISTATWGSLEEAEKGRKRPYRMRDAHPLHDGQLSRLGWWGNKVVGRVGVLRVPLRIGRATLVTAGIGGVCVDPAARNQGIASILLSDALKASRQAGLSLSLLFGIPGFYHRFGFVPAFAGHATTFLMSTRKNLPDLPRWRALKARPSDVPMMLELYNCIYGHLDGTAVRNPRLFLRRKGDISLILRGPRKGDMAYMILQPAKKDDKEELQVIEAAGQGSDWSPAVLHEAMRQADKRKFESLIFCLPAEHAVSRQMIFCNASDRTDHAANAAAMVAVLDFVGLAREMAPEWSASIAAAGVTVPKAGLLVRFRDEVYRWWPNRADGRVELMPARPKSVDVEFNDGLARLVMGYGTPDAVMDRYGIKVKEAALPILRAIFPQRQCALSLVDYF